MMLLLNGTARVCSNGGACYWKLSLERREPVVALAARCTCVLRAHAVLYLYLETGGGDFLGTLSKTHPRAAARTQSKFTLGLVAALGASQDGVARLSAQSLGREATVP